MRNVKTLPPGPGNVFAIKNSFGIIELPTLRTTRRCCIRDFVKTEITPWAKWKKWGYRVIPMTLRAARQR